MYIATSIDVLMFRVPALPSMASDSTARKMRSPAVSLERTTPAPSHVGQAVVVPSTMPERRRWRDISRRPKEEMRPTWMRARSVLSASLNFFSTARLLRFSSMSMKSTTIRPARSRSRHWRANSLAASIFVFSAVCSILRSRVALPEFTSTDTKASVWLMTK